MSDRVTADGILKNRMLIIRKHSVLSLDCGPNFVQMVTNRGRRSGGLAAWHVGFGAGEAEILVVELIGFGQGRSWDYGQMNGGSQNWGRNRSKNRGSKSEYKSETPR